MGAGPRLTALEQWLGERREGDRGAGPVYHVNAQACPFFIVHGNLDRVVPLQQSRELNDALKKAGVASTLVVVKGAGHGVNDSAPALGAIEFLRRELGVQ